MCRVGDIGYEYSSVDSAEHTLLLAFDTDDPEYARGFEAGRLWAAIREEEGEIEAIVHTANVEMLMRMSEALDRVVVGEEMDATWTRARVLPQGAVPEPSPGPGYL